MDDPLNLANRKKIFQLISSRPGIHVREMERDLGMTAGVLTYHLDVLKKESLVSAESDGYWLRYYPAKGFAKKNRQMVALLRQDQLRNIVMLVLRDGRISHQAIRAEMGISKSTLSYHLSKLVVRHMLVREKVKREAYYSAADPELLINALLVVQGGEEDRVEDRFAEIWRELRPRR